MSWLHALRERTVGLFFGHVRDGDLREEIDHHLEMETARQIAAGADVKVARARALARFGNPRTVTDTTRDARGEQLMEGGMQDLQWALRSLRKSPGFTALAVVTLALGVGAATVAFTVLDTVLLRPLPYRDADRLVFLQERTPKLSLRPPSYPNFADWRDLARSFQGVISAMYPFSVTVTAGGPGSEPMRATALGVSRDFFATLGVRPVVGREFTADENRLGGPEVAMVSYEFWQTQMGARKPLGSIRVGSTPAAVVGVTPPRFQFNRPADLYFPHEQGPGTIRSAHNYMVVGRLKNGVTLDEARAEMGVLSKALLERYGTETEAASVELRSFRDFLIAN